MTLSESDRRAIFVGLEPILGEQVANNFMTVLPLQPPSELVTRADMHANTLMLRGEMAELRAELRGEMAELRAEFKTDMGELRGEVTSEIAELRVSMQRWMSGAMAANTIALITALIT